MPVFRLPDEIVFPSPDLAEEDGLLAVGGDLGVERLLLAYSMGIFPWYSEGSPILWWSPDPRLVLFPEELKISRSLRQTLKKGIFGVTFDTAFEEVMRGCAEIRRKDGQGTWITQEMIEAYCRLHEVGFAHSVESRVEGRLAGGLYGVALGGVFFGESMFSRRSDASKVAFVSLVQRLAELGFRIIDCQMTTSHLMSLGAREIPRAEFLRRMKKALRIRTQQGTWDGQE
ncbi:MAG: leucyl/phenylalanyl-tRNA--protein transferase [Nitrospiraceae bacterium]|nr:leucyl/phenylalanyl-tRNA--protein transferase [Nitrospiraceae bacterium]